MEGIHLCTVRLDLLPLNTMGPLRIRHLEDVEALRSKSSRDLRELGRLPYPMIRHRGKRGFRRISWDDALQFAARQIRATSPDRLAFFITSRGMTNESYYVANKVARFLGTNHIDNSSRPCHSPSTTGLKETLGVAASTCSYSDWIGSDLIVFFGSDVPNNQPVTTKYLYYAKKQGTKIAVVNPMREPGLERYWVPSVPDSALFGTRFADAFFPIHTGGDIAFVNGVLEHMIEKGWIHDTFVADHTTGFEALGADLEKQSWEELEQQCGLQRQAMFDFAHLYVRAETAVFVWSMGITHHRFGVDNIRAIVNIVLSSAMLVDPAYAVLLFPAQTRYEQRGGGTETSTERRVYFSPEIPGRRIGEARAEWEIFMQLAERVRPDTAKFIHFDDAAAIRKEIAAAIPTYEGIQNLREKGDVFQYGGPRLCEGGTFPTPDGKARFSVVRPPDLDIPEGQFLLSTRRGKQFNSMIQGEIDPLLGAVRRDILLSEEDAAALHLQEGDPIAISNDLGSYQGTVRFAPIRPRNVQIYWPEGNVLIRRGVLDPACEMPDYNALVRIEAVRPAAVNA